MEQLPASVRGFRLGAARIERELDLGAHLETSRAGYKHHGVYVGGGKVVHYAGFCRRWRAGPVEEVTLVGFSAGHTIRIVEHPTHAYSPREIVDRARSRLGEREYRLLTNNCEHFCNWCTRGLNHSPQIKRPVALVFRVLAHALARAKSRARFCSPRAIGGPEIDIVAHRPMTHRVAPHDRWD
jgi:hypothetical protein